MNLAKHSASFARALMLIAGASGYDLNDSQAETLVNAALIIIPILWSQYEKWDTERQKQAAQRRADLAIRLAEGK
jgi:hypothetical protein